MATLSIRLNKFGRHINHLMVRKRGKPRLARNGVPDNSCYREEGGPLVSRHKTAELIERGAEILRSHHPMTVRQVYYQLISGHVLENSRSNYKAVVNALRDARLEGLIPWEFIEDRLRRPRTVSMWS